MVAPGINTCGTSDPVKAQSFADSLQEKLTAQPATRMPNGLTSMMPCTTQPWLHSARKNARMLTASRFAGKKCSQSRRPSGKQCWLTGRTLSLTLSPSACNALQAARIKAKQTANCCANEYWQNLCAKIQQWTVATQRGCMRASKLPPALRASKQPRSNQRLPRSSLIRACSCSSTQPRTSSQTLPSMPCLGCQ